MAIIVITTILSPWRGRYRQAESKQRKPFVSPQGEAFVNLQRTADRLLSGVEKTLKQEGLSPAQYNVLRILRGSSPDGLACREVGARMITRDPDITRLLDRLEAQGLIARSRDTGDRRVVRTKITPKGNELLRRLDEPVEARNSSGRCVACLMWP